MATKRNTVVIVDNVDIDNPLAALAACSPTLELGVKAIIVTGRPAHPDRTATITDCDPSYSQGVLRLNVKRMKGLLTRAGYDVPVFAGLIPSRTIVPHSAHIDEGLLDLHGDERVLRLDGTFQDAIDLLCETEGPIDFIVGGPLTELAVIMYEPRLSDKLGMVTCQLDLFGSSNATTMAGNGQPFNSAADRIATWVVLANWPGDVFMVPTNITKQPELGFDHPTQLRMVGASDEIVNLYTVFWKEALRPHGERIYPHDVHPVLMMAQLRYTYGYPYGWERVQIDNVDEDGKVIATPRFSMTSPGRHVITSANPDLFTYRLQRALQ